MFKHNIEHLEVSLNNFEAFNPLIFMKVYRLRGKSLEVEVNLIKKPVKTHKMAPRCYFYNVLEPFNPLCKCTLSTRIIKDNLKSRYIPVFKIEELYKPKDRYYKEKGNFLRRVLKYDLILAFDRFWVPPYILLKHLSDYLRLPYQEVECALKKNHLNMIYKLDQPYKVLRKFL